MVGMSEATSTARKIQVLDHSGRRSKDEDNMRLGFTGTRKLPTEEQLQWLAIEMIGNVTELHHGDCIGSDAQAHLAALACGHHVIVHPPENKSFSIRTVPSVQRGITVLPAKGYHARSRDIVEACDRLIALTDGPERQHSGTWYTINHAVTKGVPVTICYPDGRVEER